MTKNNYIFEKDHKVTTKDGYRLNLFRIPGKVGDKRTGKPVVLFQHGLLDSAVCWISHNAKEAPAFWAVEQGFDVWLGNSRGNVYSRDHVRLNPNKDKEFWDYSFQEMGEYDVPANVDYITRVTGVQKISYVGHSQGTSQMYYALATNEDYLSTKVNLFVALGPVMRLTNCRSGPLVQLSKNIKPFADSMN